VAAGRYAEAMEQISKGRGLIQDLEVSKEAREIVKAKALEESSKGFKNQDHDRLYA